MSLEQIEGSTSLWQELQSKTKETMKKYERKLEFAQWLLAWEGYSLVAAVLEQVC